MMEWITLTTFLLVGFVIGSFLNVVIHRGPVIWGLIDESHSQYGTLARPGSYCPFCQHSLSVKNLIPVISYFLQGGRCTSCQAPISRRYPTVEILGGIAALVTYFTFGLSFLAFAFCLFYFVLITAATIDLETGYLPDMLTLPLLALGICLNTVDLVAPFPASIIGGIMGYGVFRAIGELFKIVRKKEGLGQGDAKLLGAIGAWGGWEVLAPTVFIAAMISLIGVGIWKLAKKPVDANTEIPLGPALALAGAIFVTIFSTGLPASFGLSG